MHRMGETKGSEGQCSNSRWSDEPSTMNHSLMLLRFIASQNLTILELLRLGEWKVMMSAT